jgi:ubiquitin-like protein Pup
MAEQVTKPHISRQEADTVAAEDAERVAASVAKGRDTVKDIDALLDEIDEVLEENASVFVQSFRQAGGE